MPDSPVGQSGGSRPRGSLSYHEDGDLHLWECPWLLQGPQYRDYERCGYITTGPGNCPYDHAETVALVPLVAVVLCSDCRSPIPRDDGRAPDGRLICGPCSINYIGNYEDDDA